MRKKILTGIGGACAACALVFLLGVGWLMQQQGSGSEAAFLTFQSVIERDPAHSVVYARAYMLFLDVSDGNVQHYLVHRSAALVARLMGNTSVAEEQESRASRHALGSGS